MGLVRDSLLMMLNNSTKYHEATTITCEVTARTRYKLHNFDLWPLSVTLTFEIESWVLFVTRLLMMLNNYTKYYEATTITCEVTARTRYKLHNFDLWPLSVTLTVDIESWFLYATRLLMMLNISTKYREDTTITCEVTARTRSDACTHTQPKENCGDYVSLTASGLDKNQTTMSFHQSG